VAAIEPEPGEFAGQPEQAGDVAAPLQPDERRPQVVVLGLQVVEPGGHLAPFHGPLVSLGQPQAEGGVGCPHLPLLVHSRQRLQPELAHRL
jgi:hypothetical protein